MCRRNESRQQRLTYRENSRYKWSEGLFNSRTAAKHDAAESSIVSVRSFERTSSRSASAGVMRPMAMRDKMVRRSVCMQPLQNANQDFVSFRANANVRSRQAAQKVPESGNRAPTESPRARHTINRTNNAIGASRIAGIQSRNSGSQSRESPRVRIVDVDDGKIRSHFRASSSLMASAAVISPFLSRSSTSERDGEGLVSTNSSSPAMRLRRALMVGIADPENLLHLLDRPVGPEERRDEYLVFKADPRQLRQGKRALDRDSAFRGFGLARPPSARLARFVANPASQMRVWSLEAIRGSRFSTTEDHNNQVYLSFARCFIEFIDLTRQPTKI